MRTVGEGEPADGEIRVAGAPGTFDPAGRPRRLRRLGPGRCGREPVGEHANLGPVAGHRPGHLLEGRDQVGGDVADRADHVPLRHRPLTHQGRPGQEQTQDRELAADQDHRARSAFAQATVVAARAEASAARCTSAIASRRAPIAATSRAAATTEPVAAADLSSASRRRRSGAG